MVEEVLEIFPYLVKIVELVGGMVFDCPEGAGVMALGHICFFLFWRGELTGHF